MLRHQQKVKRRFDGGTSDGNKFMAMDQGNATVVGKKEVVVKVALATQPEMFDLNLGPNWEFNFAPGFGLTGSTDHFLIKMIIGRRLKLGSR